MGKKKNNLKVVNLKLPYLLCIAIRLGVDQLLKPNLDIYVASQLMCHNWIYKFIGAATLVTLLNIQGLGSAGGETWSW